jgi:hypothetical protein
MLTKGCEKEVVGDLQKTFRSEVVSIDNGFSDHTDHGIATRSPSQKIMSKRIVEKKTN